MNVLVLALVLVLASVADGQTNEERVRAFLSSAECQLLNISNWYSEVSWEYATNITDENAEKESEVGLIYSQLYDELGKNASRFNVAGLDPDLVRQIKMLSEGVDPNKKFNETIEEKISHLGLEMETIYSTGKVCLSEEPCLSLEPGLTRLMANSRDYDELRRAWVGWREATGDKMKDTYAEYIKYLNMTVYREEFTDIGDKLRSAYESPTFEHDVQQLYEEIKPLYEQLHAYVRRKLRHIYGAERFPSTGHIPAHILGNMWAQTFENLFEDLRPYPNKSSIDVTDNLKEQNYTALKMFEKADEFFKSLGLRPVTETFWEKSVIEKPEGIEMVCHASAWDFSKKGDVRIKMCTDVNMEDFVTIHHEMGHIQYYLQYENQSILYREGANPGFHEAVGDTIALSVMTPTHLESVGLLENTDTDKESDLNFLMLMALQKIAFLPFGYLIDQWRWSVYRGDTTPKTYNDDWWALRCKYQGLSPPVPRYETNFDPGAKYHVAANVPYIRYFVSFIIQFQFHQALCNSSGFNGSLHRCDIYRSEEAGKLLGEALAMGKSKPWQDVMEKLTGQREMSAKPLMQYFEPLMDWLRKQNEQEDVGWTEECPDHLPVGEFLSWYNETASHYENRVMEAVWAYSTNITEHNQKEMISRQVEQAEFKKRARLDASGYDSFSLTDEYRRRLEKIKDIGTAAQPNITKYQQLSETIASMESIYSKAEVCFEANNCLHLEPGLTELMATSKDYDQLLQAWQGWREVTGAKVKNLFSDYVSLSNEAVSYLNYSDTSSYWKSWYESPEFASNVQDLYEQIRPLYEHLHGFVRRKLQQVYSDKKFPETGHIPAHLLGNMWAQQWTNLLNVVKPFPDKTGLDVTAQMEEKNMTVDKMFNMAEDFFVTLGLENMTSTFREKSMLTRPQDSNRQVVCHGSAEDFYKYEDFRIKMCTSVNQEDLVTVHHEMGHIEYFMLYADQPKEYRDGANPGFHEAVGDVIALSVQTPQHMHKIGLLDKVETDRESDLNFLMSMALQRVAFLPFGYLIDKWRWDVFSGAISPDQYNDHWWDLRCRYQGLSSPVTRNDQHFDPGAKYHVVADVPYIRYFVSFILQFQFHQALCNKAGHTGPLHQCDIYKNETAGSLLREALSLGSSKPWPEVLKLLTGSDKMDAGPLMAYFKPLLDYLRKENGNDYGWQPTCPKAKSITTQQPPKSDNQHNEAQRVSLFSSLLVVVLLATWASCLYV